MSYQWIKVDQQDGIVTITLNDPDTLNAVNHEMNREIAAEMDRVDRDDEVRVLILTGEGRGFCSGGNIKVMTGQGKSIMPPLQSPRAELFPHNIDICQVVYGLRRMSKPAIAAVNGPCVGSGIGLAAGCDVRIASEKARFGWVFVRRGLLPDDGSLPLVPQIIGYAKAFEWGATGRILSAQEALDIGFVREVVPHDQLLPKCVELAREMIENCPPISLELFKLALVESLTMAPEHAILMGDKAQLITRATEDHTEALRAFAEKRKPVWKRR